MSEHVKPKVNVKITVKMPDGISYELTLDQARALLNELQDAIGKNAPFHIQRSYEWPRPIQFWGGLDESRPSVIRDNRIQDSTGVKPNGPGDWKITSSGFPDASMWPVEDERSESTK